MLPGMQTDLVLESRVLCSLGSTPDPRVTAKEKGRGRDPVMSL